MTDDIDKLKQSTTAGSRDSSSTNDSDNESPDETEPEPTLDEAQLSVLVSTLADSLDEEYQNGSGNVSIYSKELRALLTAIDPQMSASGENNVKTTMRYAKEIGDLATGDMLERLGEQADEYLSENDQIGPMLNQKYTGNQVVVRLIVIGLLNINEDLLHDLYDAIEVSKSR